MAGHYGSERVTVRNLKIVRIDVENHVILVKGAVPGPDADDPDPAHQQEVPARRREARTGAAKKGASLTKKK